MESGASADMFPLSYQCGENIRQPGRDFSHIIVCTFVQGVHTFEQLRLVESAIFCSHSDEQLLVPSAQLIARGRAIVSHMLDWVLRTHANLEQVLELVIGDVGAHAIHARKS